MKGMLWDVNHNKQSNMSKYPKYIRKDFCFEYDEKLYKAVKPLVFDDCDGCAFYNICNGDTTKDASDLPVCSISSRRDQQPVIFVKVEEGEIFKDKHEIRAFILECRKSKLMKEYINYYEMSDSALAIGDNETYSKYLNKINKISDKLNKIRIKLSKLK